MPTNTMTFKKLQTIFFFLLIIILGLAALYIVRPFIYPIFWAAVFAILGHPFYKWTNKHLKMKNTSALITVTLTVLVILLPLVLMGLLLIQQSAALHEKLTQGDVTQTIGDVADWIQNTPLGPWVTDAQSQWSEYLANGAKSIGSFLLSNVRSFTQNTFSFILMVFIMLYTLFYFLKDGTKILKRLMHLSPLGDHYEELLYERFTSTTRATLKSTLIIGGLQGTAGGLLFWATGVEGAFVWAVIMTILAIVPAIGSFLVWIPAALIMLVTGQIWQGVTILLVGFIIINSIDNVLRPPLVGKDIQMHPLLVLFSTLGGLFVFGITGFIIGPIIMALFLAVLSIYDHFYRHELEHNE